MKKQKRGGERARKSAEMPQTLRAVEREILENSNARRHYERLYKQGKLALQDHEAWGHLKIRSRDLEGQRTLLLLQGRGA